MALLWVVAIDLLAGFTDLLDDQELGIDLHNPFDLRLFVAGNDDELVALSDNCRVSVGCNFDRLDTRRATALAVKRK